MELELNDLESRQNNIRHKERKNIHLKKEKNVLRFLYFFKGLRNNIKEGAPVTDPEKHPAVFRPGNWRWNPHFSC